MKRIGFDARYISDRYHGIGRYAYRLLEALVRLDRERTYVVFRGQGIDSRFDWRSLESYPNVEICEGPWPLYWPKEQVTWPYYLTRQNVDLFHSPYFVAPVFWGTSSKFKYPVVITIHDLIFERYPEYMPLAWARPYYRMLMQHSIRRANKIISVSQSTAKDLQEYYPLALRKQEIVPEGVDGHFRLIQDKAALESIRARYELFHPFILSVGARRPHKNLDRLIEAYGLLKDSIPQDLVFAGAADNRFPDTARQTAQQSGLNGKVRFLDWIPEIDLPGLYNLADVVVLPSLLEGFGLPALEAMACGTPVIAAGNSSFPEVIGDAGILVDTTSANQIAEAIGNVLVDRTVHQRCRSTGLQRVEHFSWDIAAQQVITLYNEVLD